MNYLSSRGNQLPRNGFSYAGIICMTNPTAEIREFIEVPLISPLIANKKYCIECYVSLGEISKYAIDTIQCYFSNNLITNGPPCTLLPYTAQVDLQNASGTAITDSVGWVRVYGEYTATGGEQYLIIGNFNSDGQTNYVTVNANGNLAYYFIDDVSVIACDTIVVPDTLFIPNVFTPNYDGVNDLFVISGLTKGDKVQIYNRWGTLVFETESEKAFWDGYTTSGMPCNNGIYFYVVTLQSGETKKGYLTLIK